MLQCCQLSSLDLVEINLLGARPQADENTPGVFDPSNKFEAQINFISRIARKLKAVKMSLIVKVEVLDARKNVIEKTESSFMSCVKYKPFQNRERLSLDLD